MLFNLFLLIFNVKMDFELYASVCSHFSCLFMPPTLKKGEHISACPYVCMYVCMYGASRYRRSKRQTHIFFELSPHVRLRPFEKQGMKFCKCSISKRIEDRYFKLLSADRR